MNKIYWSNFIALSILIIGSVLVVILISVLAIKNVLSKKFFSISIVLLLLLLFFEIYSIIPYAKDYSLVSSGDFLEDDAIVVEFTYVKCDLDGTGQIQYSKPKFYIENKNEYIVLIVKDVAIGKMYRIRYLPNTRICEIVYCIE